MALDASLKESQARFQQRLEAIMARYSEAVDGDDEIDLASLRVVSDGRVLRDLADERFTTGSVLYGRLQDEEAVEGSESDDDDECKDGSSSARRREVVGAAAAPVSPSPSAAAKRTSPGKQASPAARRRVQLDPQQRQLAADDDALNGHMVARPSPPSQPCAGPGKCDKPFCFTCS